MKYLYLIPQLRLVLVTRVKASISEFDVHTDDTADIRLLFDLSANKGIAMRFCNLGINTKVILYTCIHGSKYIVDITTFYPFKDLNMVFASIGGHITKDPYIMAKVNKLLSTE